MKETIKNYSVGLCIIASVGLIIIASLLYPGGSIVDKNSIGFDWTKNFISNLFANKAINGLKNPGRIWATIGIAFHSLGYGIFFIHMAKKITTKNAARVLKAIGTTNILFTFLIATPLHDKMVILSSTLFLIGLFYITVYLLKTKLHLFKWACISCLLIFYFTLFLYGCGNWGVLAIMQKVCFISAMLLVIGLEYHTTPDDFSKSIQDSPTQ